MKIALAVFKYFPFGGVQNDMRQTALTAAAAGHEVHIYADKWQGPMPDQAGITVHLLPCRGFTNHARAKSFERKFHRAIAAAPVDVTLAFDRVPGCDLYFTADNCLVIEMRKKHSAAMLRLLPRYRVFLDMEKRIFERGTTTLPLVIADRQKIDFTAVYGTEPERYIEIPPGINPKFRMSPDNRAELRRKWRESHQVPANALLAVMLGSDFVRKGGDRAVRAFAALPETLRRGAVLVIAGNRDPRALLALAAELGVGGAVRFPGGVTDTEALLSAADIMIHPARNEATGNALVEGIACGLPVICSAVCGFAKYVKASSGLVLPEPFCQNDLNRMLADAIPRLAALRTKVAAAAEGMDLYSRPRVIVAELEKSAAKKTMGDNVKSR